MEEAGREGHGGWGSGSTPRLLARVTGFMLVTFLGVGHRGEAGFEPRYWVLFSAHWLCCWQWVLQVETFTENTLWDSGERSARRCRVGNLYLRGGHWSQGANSTPSGCEKHCHLPPQRPPWIFTFLGFFHKPCTPISILHFHQYAFIKIWIHAIGIFSPPWCWGGGNEARTGRWRVSLPNHPVGFLPTSNLVTFPQWPEA